MNTAGHQENYAESISWQLQNEGVDSKETGEGSDHSPTLQFVHIVRKLYFSRMKFR